MLRIGTKQTPYENWKDRKPNIHYFHTFWSKCNVLNDGKHLGIFDSKNDEGVFTGYSKNSWIYKIYILRTQMVVESINVKIDDTDDYWSYSKEPKIIRLEKHTEASLNI